MRRFSSLFLIPSLAVVTLASCTTPTGDWWTFQHDERRTGRGTAIGSRPKPYWQVQLVTGTTSLTPAIFGAIGDTFRVFIGSGYGDGRLFALSPYNGSTLWTFAAAPNNGFFGAPVSANGRVYIASKGQTPHVYALNQANGAVVWQTPLPGTGSGASVLVANGHVYVNTDQHTLFALDQGNGSIAWQVNTSPGATSQESSPSSAGLRLYLGSDDGLFAFNALNGAQLWKYNLPALVGFSSAVIDTTAPALVFIGTNDFKVHAVNAVTGANVWIYNGAATMAFHTVATAFGMVYTFDYMDVKALDRNTGAVLWSQNAGVIPRHAPLITGRVVVFHDNANATSMNAVTGAIGWQLPVPGNGNANAPGAAMATALEILLVPNKGYLYAFR